MKRPVESKQRKMRMLTFIVNAAGTAVTGPDTLQVTLADTGTGVKTITLDEAFASATSYTVNVTPATSATVFHVEITSASVFVIKTFAVDGITAKDSIVHVQVLGSDASGQY